MFETACPENLLAEGGLHITRVQRKLVLIVWPKGGERKAYRGLCPHNESPLDEAFLQGDSIVCPHHKWLFDAQSGTCTKGQKACALKELPLEIADGEIRVALPAKKRKADEA